MIEAVIRPLEKKDEVRAVEIIRAVLPTLGMAGPGCASNDPEMDCLHDTYSKPRSAYFVVEQGSVIVGVGGIAPLKGGDADTCELQKMYLLPEFHGKGLGRQLIEICMDAGRNHGFTRCYIETFKTMKDAHRLYEKYGFIRLNGPMGNTGHWQCTHWYLKGL